MLESSAALYPELCPRTAHRTGTNMEKNPNSKVPPRSSSTGPTPGDSKPKTGEKRPPHTTQTRRSQVIKHGVLPAKHSSPCGLLGPRSASAVVFIWKGWSHSDVLPSVRQRCDVSHATLYFVILSLLGFVHADTHTHTTYFNDPLLEKESFTFKLVGNNWLNPTLKLENV